MKKLTSHSSFSDQLRIVPLIVLIVAGWVVAPVVHDVGHAVERASLMHVHSKEDGITLREGCKLVNGPSENCFFCQIKILADLRPEKTQVSPPNHLPNGTQPDDLFYSVSSLHFSARAPPLCG